MHGFLIYVVFVNNSIMCQGLQPEVEGQEVNAIKSILTGDDRCVTFERLVRLRRKKTMAHVCAHVGRGWAWLGSWRRGCAKNRLSMKDGSKNRLWTSRE